MARPLRIEQPGGHYHVTARGNEHKDVFRDDADRFRFLALPSDYIVGAGERQAGEVGRL